MYYDNVRCSTERMTSPQRRGDPGIMSVTDRFGATPNTDEPHTNNKDTHKAGKTPAFVLVRIWPPTITER